MKRNIEIIEGEVMRNPYGDWDDVDKGLYVDGDKIDSVINKYKGKTIKITIEETEQ